MSIKEIFCRFQFDFKIVVKISIIWFRCLHNVVRQFSSFYVLTKWQYLFYVLSSYSNGWAWSGRLDKKDFDLLEFWPYENLNYFSSVEKWLQFLDIRWYLSPRFFSIGNSKSSAYRCASRDLNRKRKSILNPMPHSRPGLPKM